MFLNFTKNVDQVFHPEASKLSKFKRSASAYYGGSFNEHIEYPGVKDINDFLRSSKVALRNEGSEGVFRVVLGNESAGECDFLVAETFVH